MSPILPFITRTTGAFAQVASTTWNYVMKKTYSRSPRQQAIDAKCKDCGYDHLVKGTWRYQIEMCPCTDCPLYEFRPVTIRHYEDEDVPS